MNKNAQDQGIHKTLWRLKKFATDEDFRMGRAYEERETKGNILTNAGIDASLTLVAGGGGTAFNNANAFLGVGDGTTAASATQTDLVGTNKLRKAMNTSYPTFGTNQKITFQSDFGSADANFSWQEFAAFNASSAGTMLDRKTSDQSSKVEGQTWQLTLEISIS